MIHFYNVLLIKSPNLTSRIVMFEKKSFKNLDIERKWDVSCYIRCWYDSQWTHLKSVICWFGRVLSSQYLSGWLLQSSIHRATFWFGLRFCWGIVERYQAQFSLTCPSYSAQWAGETCSGILSALLLRETMGEKYERVMSGYISGGT